MSERTAEAGSAGGHHGGGLERVLWHRYSCLWSVDSGTHETGLSGDSIRPVL
jgi:hypothetical protein